MSAFILEIKIYIVGINNKKLEPNVRDLYRDNLI